MTGKRRSVDELIRLYSPRGIEAEAARFARRVVGACPPEDRSRTKALLYASSRAAAFALSVGVPLREDVVLSSSFIERLVLVATLDRSVPTRLTIRANLRYLQRLLLEHTTPPPVGYSRARAKAPYSPGEIAQFLLCAKSQPTPLRRARATGLICLGAGAGLVGADLRCVRGSDITPCFGGLVVEVKGKRARFVPVLSSFAGELEHVAEYFEGRYVIGGAEPHRRNVTSGLIASLSGGSDLPRLEIARLRASWLWACAEAIGLRAFLLAAGISCSQRLGDVVSSIPPPSLSEAVRVLSR